MDSKRNEVEERAWALRSEARGLYGLALLQVGRGDREDGLATRRRARALVASARKLDRVARLRPENSAECMSLGYAADAASRAQ